MNPRQKVELPSCWHRVIRACLNCLRASRTFTIITLSLTVMCSVLHVENKYSQMNYCSCPKMVDVAVIANIALNK